MLTDALVDMMQDEADAYSRQWMIGAGIPPLALVSFFERVARLRKDSGIALPIAISSHPADEERIRFFGGR